MKELRRQDMFCCNNHHYSCPGVHDVPSGLLQTFFVVKHNFRFSIHQKCKFV